MTLPTIGVLKYNGVTFPVETNGSITATPVYDDSHRTVKYVLYRIEAETTLTATSITFQGDSPTPADGQQTDTVLGHLRKRLLYPGGELQCYAEGFGNLTVNSSDNTANGGGTAKKDVMYGPSPLLMSWKPIGPAAAEVHWTCEVHLPECSEGCSTPVYQNQFLSLNYSMQWSIDKEGYTTRNLNINYEIPATRASICNKTIQDNADANRYLLAVANTFTTPLGFQRTSCQRSIDVAKQKMTLQIVDRQMGENILPPDCTELQASHSLRPKSNIAGPYIGTLTASITLARGVSKSKSLDIFFDLVRLRTDQAFRAGCTALPISLTMDEPDIFGTSPTGRFTLSYIIVPPNATKGNSPTVGQRMKQIRDASGLWVPISTDWKKWNASMVLSMVDNFRGHAGMSVQNGDDAIVDLCVSPTTTTHVDEPTRGGTILKTDLPPLPVICPPPESSYLKYINKIRASSETNVMEHKLTASTGNIDAANKKETNVFNTNGVTLSEVIGKINNTPADTSEYQQRVTPTVKFIVEGEAIRMCYHIIPAEVDTINGEKVYKEDGDFQEWVEYYMGIPIYKGKWQYTYAVEYNTATLSTTVNTPTNYQLDAGSNANGQVQLTSSGFSGNAFN